MELQLFWNSIEVACQNAESDLRKYYNSENQGLDRLKKPDAIIKDLMYHFAKMLNCRKDW